MWSAGCWGGLGCHYDMDFGSNIGMMEFGLTEAFIDAVDVGGDGGDMFSGCAGCGGGGT